MTEQTTENAVLERDETPRPPSVRTPSGDEAVDAMLENVHEQRECLYSVDAALAELDSEIRAHGNGDVPAEVAACKEALLSAKTSLLALPPSQRVPARIKAEIRTRVQQVTSGSMDSALDNDETSEQGMREHTFAAIHVAQGMAHAASKTAAAVRNVFTPRRQANVEDVPEHFSLERPESETTHSHRRTAPAEVRHAQQTLRRAKHSGGYVDVQRASQALARANHGGRDDDETWNEGRTIQQNATVERVWNQSESVLDAGVVYTEAAGRNMTAGINKVWIAGATGNGGYLATLNADPRNRAIVAALDHNKDGKVSMAEFERAMYNADMSYAKIAAFDRADSSNWTPDAVENRTISQNEFMKAARALATVSGVTQDRGLATVASKGNRRFDENGDGKITMDEFRRTLERSGYNLQRADLNHDGKLSVGEMSSAMLQVEVKAHMRGASAADIAKVTVEMRQHGITFDKIDTAGEFNQVLQQVHQPAAPAGHKPTGTHTSPAKRH